MKVKLQLIAMLAMFVFTGCGDDSSSPYKCSSCADSPEANASYDATGQGVYKGVVSGSTGTIQFNIANDGTYSATLVLDGTTYALTTEATYSVTEGFSGQFVNVNAGISMTFYVSITGSTEVYSIVIPDHEGVAITVYKELSTALAMGFEGTFSGDNAGTFNMVIRRNDDGSGAWYAISRENPVDGVQQQANYESGEISTEGVISSSGDVTVTGVISGDNISGTWSSPTPESGTWKGKRTL